MGNPLAVKSDHLIPFDIDPFMNGGCNGSDWWDDRYGNKVHLLTAENGDAYLCPEKPGEGWRIFIGPHGKPRLLSGKWPADPSGQASSFDGSSQVWDILKCAARTKPDAVLAFRETLMRSSANPERMTPLRLNDVRIDLGPSNGPRKWELRIECGVMQITDGDKGYKISENGAFTWVDDCIFDGEHPSDCPAPKMSRDDETWRQWAKDLLMTARTCANEADKIAIDIALEAMEAATNATQEIEAFEKYCYADKEK